MNCLINKRKSIATVLLTIFYCQTVLAAYQPWSNNHYNHRASSELRSFYNSRKVTLFRPDENINIASESPIAEKHKSPERKFNVADLGVVDIGGPTQPEMSSFKSVNSDNMVDLFSGDFSYNIPLLDVGGYPINIFYKSGITMDQEASWVGLGWNINPGTITRNLRGIPDDFDGKNDIIQKSTSVATNKTIGGDIGADVEIFGLPSQLGGDSSLGIGIGVSLGAFYNTYRGWGMQSGLHATISSGFASMGSLSGGLSIVNNSQEGLTLSPSLSVGLSKKFNDDNNAYSGAVSIGGGFSYNARSGLVSNLSTGLNLSHDQTQKDDHGHVDHISGSNLYSSSISFASPSYSPSADIPFTNSQFTFTAKIGGELWGVHPSAYLKGYVSKQYIDPSDINRTFPAYGYLHYQDANDNPQALLDFNREKDIVYREKPAVPNIAVPSYTYDLFCINGEGTGGMFRAYRGDIGFVHDPYVTTKNATGAASVDLGFGNAFHGGVDINVNHASTTTGAWTDGNPLANTVKFKQSDSVFEAAYFRNPGEKSINPANFYKSIGDDDVVTAQLYQVLNGPSITSTNYLQHWKNKTSTNVSTLLSSGTDFKIKRDKRTQVISYLTAAEASRVGLDTIIYNYSLNSWAPVGCDNDIIKKEARVNDFRQPNHISEIDVLNNDGRRYVYGLPVYNTKQVEVTFAADSVNNNKQTGLVKINAGDATQYNHRGKDNYFQKQTTSPYAHSFLLTSILSSDYVDVTGNGVSEDDLGDAIKFNYTKVAGKDSAFKWRTPYVKDSATYNEGLQTYVRDDKGSYIYGEKEVWYLNSVESKNMIAVFVLQKRSDLKSIDEMGQIANNLADTNQSKCLKEINLYSKSDYIQNGLKAKPVKTVHFYYTYDLCKGLNGDTAQGKLTLKKLWFTYNGNQKGTKNPYLFFYNNKNPNYTNTAYDRWGNYKNPVENPRSSQANLITNAEYPYALQDSISANKNAAAWMMDSIILPSSGSIKVGYESDDYAYVQNKRAMQMFNVVGLSYAAPSAFYTGSSDNSISNLLYKSRHEGESPDNLFVSIRVTNALSSAKDAYQKYLDGFSKVYFKLKVQMPTDRWGSGYEYLPVYADLDVSSIADSSKYGVLSGHSDIIWIKLQGINIAGDDNGNYSPLAKAATQFLRLNLPSKAYPGYEVSDDLDFSTAVQILGAMGSNIINAFSNFDIQARQMGWAARIDTSKSIARLNNPIYKKYGGGLRVKFIKIYDNWKNMTGQQNQAIYGQLYDYSTIKNINGIDTKISSGVASWEPMMGGEESPFRLPLEYTERPAPLAPVTMGYTETPLGESFFPAPSVGYSQVRVRSIHSNNIKSATGYQETKFYTAYDFPVITDNSLLTPDTKKRYKTSLSNFLRIKSYHYLSMSQGFKIELNDMNGKIKSQASYSETDSIHPLASSTYYYHVDDQNAESKHLNNTIKAVNQRGEIDSVATIGKDIELMMDMREQRSLTQGADYGVNVDLFIVSIFPIPVPSNIPMPQKEETRFRSVATTKVIQRFGILDSVVAIDKGSKISTDNLLYDSETGDVLLTRTRNEFNDTIYNFTYPAHWAYSGMGPAYQNINAVYNSNSNTKIKIVNGVLQPSSAYPGMSSRFESGDEILAIGRPKTGESIPENCTGQSVCPTPIFSGTAYTTTRIWAIDSKKIDSTSTLGLIFIDREGNPYSADSVNLKIIRSGHRNLASTPLSTIASLKNPIKKISNQLKVVFDSSIDILNTSAGVFNERWKVKDATYLKDTSIDNLFTATLYPSTLSIKEFNWKDGSSTSENFYANAQYVGASYDTTGTDDGDGAGSCHDKVIKNKTIVQYNFSSIPIGATIQNSSISFTPKTPGTDFCNFRYTASDHDCETKDWGASTTYYGGESNVSLKRITSPWSSTTSYSNFVTTDANKITVTQSNYTNISCKELIQDVLDNSVSRTYGLEFVISNESSTSNAHTLKYLTFNGSTSNPPLFIQYTLNNHFAVCRSAITQRNINPYVCGILGNWRNEKSLVYYSARAESDFSALTNIRKNGTIKNFQPYWNFTPGYLASNADTANWVWNSVSTLYNRKGFEIENKDPLGRYNTGAYGYNESLPIAVVQNSRFKDQFFDGLEDYGYSTQSCAQSCPIPRNVDFTLNGDSITRQYAHSGKSSLKVNALDSSVQTFPITITGYNDSQKINLLRDSSVIDTSVTPIGQGLTLSTDGNGRPAVYNGYIQAKSSGYYTISVTLPSTAGYTLELFNILTTGPSNPIIINTTVYLKAGVKNHILIYSNSGGYFTGPLDITWVSSCVSFQNVPTQNLYGAGAFYDSSVSYGSAAACKRLIGITTDSSSLIPSFKPSQGQSLVFSAWVKEQRDCLCDQYEGNRVNLTFKLSNNSDSILSFKPAGNIIEGWQRYEAIFNIPSNTVSMRIALKSTSDSPVYFDDIRMHPYNANMKSFVYDPVSLRLMAELDENNYATFYEYDDDGTLIRVKKETENGIQTIKETRSSLSRLNDQ